MFEENGRGRQILPLGHRDSQLETYGDTLDPSVLSPDGRANRIEGIITARTPLDRNGTVRVVPYQSAEMTFSTLDCRPLTAVDGQRRDVSVHGVVLAAGTSSRYGSANKLLAEISGTPVVRRATRTTVESRSDGVTVVVGHEADRVWDCVSDLSVSRRKNERYEQGQSTSVHEGVAAARERSADAVILSLGDMPHVSVKSVDALIEAYERDAGDALALAHDGTRGNPVLFDASHFEALLGVSGDVGGRDVLLSARDGLLIDVSDVGVVRDIDTHEDL